MRVRLQVEHAQFPYRSVNPCPKQAWRTAGRSSWPGAGLGLACALPERCVRVGERPPAEPADYRWCATFATFATFA